MNKRANVMDVWTFFEWMVGFVILILIVGTILYNFATIAQPISYFSAAQPMLNFMLAYPAYMDWIPLIAYGISLVFSIIAARLIPTNKAYMVLASIVVIFIFIAMMVAANIGRAFLDTSVFSAITSQLLIIPLMINNMLIFGALYIGVTLTALYAGKEE